MHPCSRACVQRVVLIDNLLVRIQFIIVMIRWTGPRHGSLNSFFHVALHLPSQHVSICTCEAPAYPRTPWGVCTSRNAQWGSCRTRVHECVGTTPTVPLKSYELSECFSQVGKCSKVDACASLFYRAPHPQTLNPKPSRTKRPAALSAPLECAPLPSNLRP